MKPLIGLKAASTAAEVLKGRAALISFAFAGCAFGFLSLAAFIYQSFGVRAVPYLVKVDSHGVVLSGGPLKPLKEVPREVSAAAMAGFIANMRSVSSDPAVQKQTILKAYAFVYEGSEASRKLDEHFRLHNPFDAGKKIRREVQILNVISLGEGQLQIDWNESTQQVMSAGFSGVRKFRAILSFEGRLGQDNDDAQKLLLNPLSIYVKDFVISEVLENVEQKAAL